MYEFAIVVVLVCIIIYIWTQKRAQTAAASAPAPAPAPVATPLKPEPVAPPVTQQSVREVAPVAPTTDLSGMWKDSYDTVLNVVAYGDKFMIVDHPIRPNIMIVFTGPGQVRADFNYNCCSGKLSPDGKSIAWDNNTTWSRMQ